jgi:late competence protein required for DNA uptake (superfamily II DNA/RNA helicase)
MAEICESCGQAIPAQLPATKVCNRCHRSLPIARFPVHLSANDGRRLMCEDCVPVRRAEVNAALQAQRKRVRQKESDRLKQNGYVWKRQRVADGESPWQLHDPAGLPVTKEEALSRIDLAEYGEDDLF